VKTGNEEKEGRGSQLPSYRGHQPHCDGGVRETSTVKNMLRTRVVREICTVKDI
jgi:hypothetical protein